MLFSPCFVASALYAVGRRRALQVTEPSRREVGGSAPEFGHGAEKKSLTFRHTIHSLTHLQPIYTTTSHNAGSVSRRPSTMASLPPLADEPESADTIATRDAHVQALLHRLLANSPIYGLMLSTMRLASVARGTVVTALTLGPEHVNSKGGLHGAVSAVIIDFTTGLAIASRDLREATGASVDMHISYLSSARVGDEVRVETRAERVGGSLAFVTVRIARVDAQGGETVVTLGQHTKYVRGTAPPTPQGMTPVR